MFADLSQKLGVGTGKNKHTGNAAAPQVNVPSKRTG
jgi:hypothetical protein